MSKVLVSKLAEYFKSDVYRCVNRLVEYQKTQRLRLVNPAFMDAEIPQALFDRVKISEEELL